MGCVHRCTFCFVRAFERLADRPFDARYGTSIRVKTNLVDVLRRELVRRSWTREQVVIGTATDPYQPAEGHFRLTRGAIEALADARTPIGLITRGPLIVRDVDVLRPPAAPGRRHVLDPDARPEVWRLTEPGTAPPSSGSVRCGHWSTLASMRASAWRRSCPDCRTIRRRWPMSYRLLATPGRPRSGRTCSTCGPGRANTSSTTWPRLAGAAADVRAPLRRSRLRRRTLEGVEARVRGLAREPVYAIGAAAPPPPETEAAVEQLSLDGLPS